jgi:cytoskeletal protein CcmA (bactofilin family)
MQLTRLASNFNMKKKLFFLLPLCATLSAGAIDFISTNRYEISESQSVSQELWLYSAEAHFAGAVSNDLFVFSANRLQLDGTFAHNIWGMGTDLELSGSVNHNTRLLARTARIAGHLDGNALVLADTIHFSTNAVVQGNVRLLGNSIILEGTLHGDVQITASRLVTVSAKIDGNLTIIAPEIILQQDARVGGDLFYTSPKELIPDEGILAGSLHRIHPASPSVFSPKQLLRRATSFMGAFIVGILFLFLFTEKLGVGAYLARTSLWRALWIGGLAFFLLPTLGLMTLAAPAGLPLALFLLGAWAGLFYLGHIVVSFAFGTFLLRVSRPHIRQTLPALFVGLLVLHIGFAIPGMGQGLRVVSSCVGVGALLLPLSRATIRIPTSKTDR